MSLLSSELTRIVSSRRLYRLLSLQYFFNINRNFQVPKLSKLLIISIIVFLCGCTTSSNFKEIQDNWSAWLTSDTNTSEPEAKPANEDDLVVIADAEHDRECAENCNDNSAIEIALENDTVSADIEDESAVVAIPVIETQQTDIWQRIRDGFQLIESNDHRRVEAELKWYKDHPDYILRVTKRAEPYIFHIVETIEKAGLPTELALLPIVESAYDPFAYSHGRAAGLWQFIPGTARLFGLKDDWWYDGRRDVVASTGAAVKFLERLNKSFDGDWLLALASYNTGPGRVSKAVKSNRKNNKSVDFWSLKLPRETSTYVPRLIAISKIVANPEKYGVSLHPVANEKVFEMVNISSQIDLAKVATLANMPLEEIYRFNPGFNHWATSPKGPHYIVLPKEKASAFEEKLATLPKDQWLSWQRYIVQRGDVLGTIAQKFNSDVATLKKVNKLRGNTIRVGDTLWIPIASEGVDDYVMSENQRLAKKQQRLEDKAQDVVEYTVQDGDSFWKIARKYGVKISELASWNGMASRDPLRAGKVLKIYRPTKTPSLSAEPPSSLRTIIKKIAYKVRNGDSIARIANKFNVNQSDIVKWNNLNTAKYLQPGQALTLFVDVQRAP